MKGWKNSYHDLAYLTKPQNFLVIEGNKQKRKIVPPYMRAYGKKEVHLPLTDKDLNVNIFYS
jgi:hypothetical protein